MANTLSNLTRVSTSTVGTGTLTLGIPVGFFLSLDEAGVPTGSVLTYAVEDPIAGREIGQGTYTAATSTLTRTTVYRSSAAGNTAKISLSGQAQVTITIAAEDIASLAPKVSPVFSGFASFGGTASATPDVLITDADTTNSRASLQIKGNAGTVETAFFGAAGSVGIGSVAPLQKLHIVTTTGDTGLRIDAYHTGASFFNSFIQLNAPRSDSADGATASGRGYIVVPGNSLAIGGSIFMGANTASGVVTGADTAIRGNQGVLEITSAGTLDLWRTSTSYFHADSAKTILGGIAGTLPALPSVAGIVPNVGIGFAGGVFAIPRFTTDTSAPRLLFGKSRGTMAAPATVAANDQLADISFAGDDGSAAGTIPVLGARILVTVVGTVSTSIVPARFDFQTRNAAGVFATRMAIGAEGGLSVGSATDPGIGNISATGTFNKVTITPPATSATLTIANTKTLTVSNTLTLAGTDASTLNIGAGGTLGSNAYSTTAFAPLASPTFTGSITFPSGLWNTNGNVGIGTAGPSVRLHIANTTADVSMRMDAYRLGASYFNSIIQLNAPRYDTADGATALGRGYIVLPGNSVAATASIFMGANGAAATITGPDTAIRGNQAVIEINNLGTFDFWKAGVSLFRIESTGGLTTGPINKVTITQPATSATLTIANLKTLTISNSITLTGTDSATYDLNALAGISGGAPLNSPTFTGTVTIPTPFTLGSTSVTSTGTQLNYLNTATGTTGTANNVLSNTPTLVTPILGVATATSINKLIITAPATSATLTIADGKTLTVSNTLTLAGTDGSTLNIGTGGTLGANAYTSTVYAPLNSPTFTGTVTHPTPFTLGAISVTATGTQLNYLAAATGTTGLATTNLVFSTSPTLVTPTLGVATATSINKVTITAPATSATLTIANTKTLTVSNTLTLAGTDSSTLNIGAGGTLGSNAYTSVSYAPLNSPTFTGTVTHPTPFTLGATSVTTTGTQLNYLNAATGTTGTTTSNLVFSNDPTLTYATLAGNVIFNSGLWSNIGNLSIGFVAPATNRVHIVHTTADAGIRIDAHRAGLSYYNSYLTFGVPRNDTADGNTVAGRGYIVVPGQSDTSNASIFMGAASAGGTVSGNYEAIRSNGGVLEVSSIGTLELWQAGTSLFRINTLGDLIVTGNIAGAGAVNKVTITQPATTATLTIANTKVFTVINTLTLAGTDGSTLNIGAGGTLGSNAYTSTTYAPLNSPTFTGTVTHPTPFTLGAISVTTTGTQLNYLNAATGTTGTATTNLVFSTSPTLVTPVLGSATATTINKVAITAPATNATLTIANLKTLTVSNTITLAGTDAATLNIAGGGTLGANAFNSTDFASLASPTFTGTVTIPTPFKLGAISVTSTGTQLNYLNAATGTTGTSSTNLVFSTSPVLVTPTLGVATATSINKLIITAPTTSATLTIADLKTLTVSNTLTLAGTDGSTLNIGAGGTLGTNAYTSTAFATLASPIFTGTVTIPTPFTLGAISVTSTGTQLNYLNAATGTTGTTSTNLVFSTSPVLVTPTLGVATATSINKLIITAPATSATLTIADLKTLTVSNTLTFAGTDSSTLNIGAGGTLGSNAYLSTAFAPLASPTFTGTVTIPTPFTLGAISVTSTGTQLNYLSAVAGTTGTTNLVLSNSPTLVTPILGVATATSINKLIITAPTTSATLTIAEGKTLTASNTLTLAGTDGSTLTIGAGGTLGSNAYTSTAFAPLASPTFTGLATVSATSAATRSSITAISDCSLYLRRSVTTPLTTDYGAALGFSLEANATNNLGAAIAFRSSSALQGGLAFLIHSPTAVDSVLNEAMWIKQNGFVSLGVGDPQRPLHIFHTVPGVRMTDTDAGVDADGTWEFRGAYDTGTTASTFDILNTGSGMGSAGIVFRGEKDATDIGRIAFLRSATSSSAVIIAGGQLATAASDGFRFEINNTTDSTFSTFHAATLATFTADANQRAYRVSNNTVDSFAVTYGGAISHSGNITQQGANGQAITKSQLTQLVTIAAAATTTTTIQIPANALVIGVSVRVTVAIPTAATFDVGVSGATTRYATALSTVMDTTSPGTIDGVRAYPTATAITITPNLTPATNAGRLRVTIHYIAITPPTS